MAKFVLNTIYLKAKWEKDPSIPIGQFNMTKVSDDVLFMIIKDDETNTSEIKMIQRPTIEFYTIKDPASAKPYNEMFIDKNLVDTHVVEYSKRDSEICKYLGIYDQYRDLKSNASKYYANTIDSKNARDNLRNFMNDYVYKSPLIYGADLDIEDFYKTRFMRENSMDVPKILNVSFYDIETYIYHFTKETVDQNNPLAPISVITYYNTKKRHFYALLLKIDEIPMQKEIEGHEDDFINNFVKEDFKDDPDISINIRWYNDEIELEQAFFQLIHEDKPDFAMAWNNNYDNKYQINRAKRLGMNIPDLWCHPDIPPEYKQFRFKEDSDRNSNPFKKSTKHFSRMWDWITCPGYTTFIDQMSLYSNLRKRSIEKSYKLDSICEKEIGANKVDLHKFGLNIRNATFKNYKIFLKYSMRDTYLLYKLEDKLKDLTTFLSLSDNTKIEKGTNISFVIKNAFYNMFLDRNQVIGNTIDYGVNESIDGAVVSDPSLLDSCPVTIDGKKTKLYKFVTDFDASSEYPSLMRQFRIGKNTDFTRFIGLTDKNNKYIMSGKDYNQYMQTKDTSITLLCNELYGLPKIETILGNLQQILMEK